jgi:hypothetical protein
MKSQKWKYYSDCDDFQSLSLERKKDTLQADAFNLMRKYFVKGLSEDEFLSEIESLSNYNILTYQELIDFLKPIASYEALESSFGKSDEIRQELKRKSIYIRSIEF